ncbi:MAG: calcium/sodium antiporter [Anaerolineales bacterium]|nr:calcium/sodium antiporter [Anaerolineales bacterium]
MLDEFFIGLPLSVNILLIILALYIVTRASHYMVDGAVYMARELRISPLVIGATVVAMGTSAAEFAVNLAVVLSDLETSTVVGNILGSNLVNIGIELGVSTLIAGLIVVPRDALEKDIPLYLAATAMTTALIMDGQINRVEAIILLALFLAANALIVQYARARRARSVLMVEVTPIEEISHPTALELTRRQALWALFGGLIVLVFSSRLLILNTTVLAVAIKIPEFIIGLVIIGPGTSLPEIASSIQAARRGHADLVLGTAFGSNLFNLLFGLGLPALIRPLIVEPTAVMSFIFMSAINITLLAFLLSDHGIFGRSRTINRVVGAYLVVTYVGFISFLVVEALGGTLSTWLQLVIVVAVVALLLVAVSRWLRPLLVARSRRVSIGASGGRILCATRGGRASRPTHTKAIELAQEMDAELLFLYVFDQTVLPLEAMPLVINAEAQILHMQRFLMQTAQEQARQAGVLSRIIVRAGSLRDQLATVAMEEKVHLVILGNPEEKGSLFKREALRSLAEEISASTGVKVLALMDEDADHDGV